MIKYIYFLCISRIFYLGIIQERLFFSNGCLTCTFGYSYFRYDGRKNDNHFGKSNVQPDAIFPDSQKGCLDANLLQQLGLTKEKMRMYDALFFNQLLLQIWDAKKSGVPKDPQIAFNSKVLNHSNLYACLFCLVGGQYSYAFRTIKIQELVHWDGILFYDVALGSSNGSIYQR